MNTPIHEHIFCPGCGGASRRVLFINNRPLNIGEYTVCVECTQPLYYPGPLAIWYEKVSVIALNNEVARYINSLILMIRQARAQAS